MTEKEPFHPNSYKKLLLKLVAIGFVSAVTGVAISQEVSREISPNQKGTIPIITITQKNPTEGRHLNNNLTEK